MFFARNRPAVLSRRQRLYRATIDTLESRRLLADFTVDPSLPIEGNNYHTLADAISAAAENDVILVAPGTYSESVLVDKALALRGAQFGNDPRAGRAGAESIISGQIAVSAPGVTVDGFSLADGSSIHSGGDVAALFVGAANATIANNIFDGADAGTGILTGGSTDVGVLTITQNHISDWSVGIGLRADGSIALSQNRIEQNDVGFDLISGNASVTNNVIRDHLVTGVRLDLLANPAASVVSIDDNALTNLGVPQVTLLGGVEAVDSVSFSNNVVTLSVGATFVNAVAPTPIEGMSLNTFHVVRTVLEDASLTLDLNVDGTGLASIDTTALAGTATVDGNDVSIDLADNFNGQTTFTFITVGGANGTVALEVEAVNDAPTSSEIPPHSINEGESATLPVASYFADVDVGDVLIFSMSGAPAFASIDSETGVLSFAPGADDAGDYSITVIASDGLLETSQVLLLTVVNVVNEPPVFTNLPDTVLIPENQIVPVFSVNAADPESTTLTYAIVDGNASGLFAIDSATGVISLTQPLDFEAAASHTLLIRVTDNGTPASAFSEAALVVNVQDVQEPTTVTLDGPTTAIEGQALTYTANASDEDAVAVLAYQWFVDGIEQIGETGAQFTITFGDQGSHTIAVSVSDRGDAAVTASLSVVIGDAPTLIPLSTSVSTVNEGASFTLTVGTLVDVDPSDIASIGQLAINWGDSTFTLVNAEADPQKLADILNGVPITFTHAYADGYGSAKTITVSVHNGETSSTATTSIIVNNVAPTGNFVTISPTIYAGSAALVNWFGQTDVSPVDVQRGLRYTYAIDSNVPGGDGMFNAGDQLIAGDGTYNGSVANSSLTIPGNLLSTPGTYRILGLLIDKDGSPFLTKSVSITVLPSAFQVVSLGGDHSGFTIVFNRPFDVSSVNVYDGIGGNLPDVVLTRAGGLPIKGTLVVNAAKNGFDYVVTGGILSVGTYTVTMRSGSDAFKDLSGAALDGDQDDIAGGDFVATFGVNPADVVLSTPDIARGPGQLIEAIPASPESMMPINLIAALPISSINFRLRYDASLISIRPMDTSDPNPANHVIDVIAGSGLPAGWSVNYAVTPSGLSISLSKLTPTAANIGGGIRELVKVRAAVIDDPANYGKAQIFSFAEIVANGNGALEAIGDRAIHKVVFLGDANFDGTVNAGDAGVIQAVVLGTRTGFANYPLLEPSILVDSSRNGMVDSQDATNVALAGFTGGRPPEIPAFTPIELPLIQGADPTFAIASGLTAGRDAPLVVPVKITDDARGIQSGQLRVRYDASLFTLLGISNGTMINGGWSVLSNIDDVTGYAEIAFYSGQTLAGASPIIGTLLELTFALRTGAIGSTSQITIDTPTPFATSPTAFYDSLGGRLTTAAVDAVVAIDLTRPTVQSIAFDAAGTSQFVVVTFSEDVSQSVAAGAFELQNLTTGSLVSIVLTPIGSDGKSYRLEFTGTGGVTNAILRDGQYRLRVSRLAVADAAGNAMEADAESTFAFVNADANQDRHVNFDDLLTLAQNYGSSSNMTFAKGDFNYDGVVNFDDLLILAQRYGTSLIVAEKAKAASPAKERSRSSLAELA